MNDQTKSKLPWRLLRRGLIGLAVLATLVAVVVTEEDWRGKHAWDHYRRAAEAWGEQFDQAAVMPALLPDSQNFFSAPSVAEIFTNHTPFNIFRGDSKFWPTNSGDWQKGRLIDLAEWRHYFRTFSQTPEGKTNGFPTATQPQTPAEDVLLALSQFNPALEALRQASLRPGARLPLAYEKGFDVVGDLLPWLADEKRCAQFLRLRTLADLDAGQSQSALEDLKLFLRVTDTLRNQPFLIAQLVRIAMQELALQPVYEGLAQHRWNDAQLADLENTLAEKDFLADFQTALRGERTCAIATFETQRLTRKIVSQEYATAGQVTTVTNSLRWMPAAYFYQNELAMVQMYDQFILPLANVTNQTVSLANLRAGQKTFQALTNRYSPYKIMARMTFPAVNKSVFRFALVQTHVNLARVACALERYHLANGSYPENLDALAPRFIAELPHDLINGQPLHYQRPASDKFVLYSVGWNETDDGGTAAVDKTGRIDNEKGDWVWKN